ncbi:MAG: HAD family hydrolase [Leptolyngbya sp. SIO3F4]|nr:HAD family hydrolase [Leptolyngbya sp. SIO3F4]
MQPDVVAFDFDGVICDGLIEYFQTAWRAYCKLFKPKSPEPPEGLANQFYPLRPVIETGWEMPMLLRALILDKTDEEIVANWPELALPFLEELGISKTEAAKTLDGERDHWIATDLDNWLGQHRFYPNMLNVLQASLEKRPTYIVSTKEGRFIQQLLKQSGVAMPPEKILGKEVKRPKYETLRLLTNSHTIDNQFPKIWFIEDRIKALQAVKQQPDLDHIELFLADWGYNLTPERQAAQGDNRISLLSLDTVVQKFDAT